MRTMCVAIVFIVYISDRQKELASQADSRGQHQNNGDPTSSPQPLQTGILRKRENSYQLFNSPYRYKTTVFSKTNTGATEQTRKTTHADNNIERKKAKHVQVFVMKTRNESKARRYWNSSHKSIPNSAGTFSVDYNLTVKFSSTSKTDAISKQNFKGDVSRSPHGVMTKDGSGREILEATPKVRTPKVRQKRKRRNRASSRLERPRARRRKGFREANDNEKTETHGETARVEAGGTQNNEQYNAQKNHNDTTEKSPNDVSTGENRVGRHIMELVEASDLLSDQTNLQKVTLLIMITFVPGVLVGYLTVTVVFIFRYKRCLCCMESCEGSFNRFFNLPGAPFNPNSERHRLPRLSQVQVSARHVYVPRSRPSQDNITNRHILVSKFEEDRKVFMETGKDPNFETKETTEFKDLPTMTRKEWLSKRLKWWLRRDRRRALSGQFSDPSAPPDTSPINSISWTDFRKVKKPKGSSDITSVSLISHNEGSASNTDTARKMPTQKPEKEGSVDTLSETSSMDSASVESEDV